MSKAVWRPDAPFRKYNKTVSEGRAEGFETGLTWDRSWTPGGPYVSQVGVTHRDQPDWVAYCELTAAVNKAWCEGFAMARKIVS